MSLKYKTEDEIDFFTELYKSLDNDNDENTDTKNCLITQLPLTDKYVELNCGHSFNYIPLYNDLVNFKNKYNSMEGSSTRLKHGEIRCPYCRKKQTKLLPYYEELGLKKIHGINYFDDSNKYLYNHYCQFLIKNTLFNDLEPENLLTNKKFIQCCNKPLYMLNNIVYCYGHKKLLVKESEMKEKKQAKQKLKEEKEQAKQKLKEEKEQAKQKLKEEKQYMKKTEKKSIENIVLGPITIEKEQIEVNNKATNETCIQILKSGPNKGNKCGCKIHLDNLCKRHYMSEHKKVIKEINEIICKNILHK